MLDFVVAQLQHHHAALRAAQSGTATARCDFLLAAGQAAQEFRRACANPATLPDEATQRAMWGALRRFFHMNHLAGGNTVPKSHVMLEHLVQRVPHLGHPSAYTTYADESTNGIIARIARSCHRRQFGRAVHNKYRVLCELEAASLV